MAEIEEKNYCIVKNGEGEYDEKKSRFLAKSYYVTSEEEVSSIIEETRKKHYDARHNCFSYIIGRENPLKKASDDGEPSGTAGRPILDVMEGANLVNALVVVTRYFGGVKLGTGGLTRAYAQAAKNCLEDSELLELVPGREFQISADYQKGAGIESFFRRNDIFIEDISYTDKQTFKVMIPDQKVDFVRKSLMDIMATSDIPEAGNRYLYGISSSGIRKENL